MEIKELVKRIDIKPSEELEEASQRVLSEFTNAGYQVYQPQYLNEMIAAKEISKVLNIYDQESKIKHSFFIISAPWTQENINLILNSFSQPDEKHLVYFLSAYPLPDILAFINENTPAAFFELEAIRNLKNLNDIYENKALIEHYFTIFSKLAKKYFNLEINYDIPQSLKNMEKALINFYRNGDDYERIDDIQINHYPYHSLMLFSLYLGELLISKFEGELFLHKEQDIKEMGIGFSKDKNDFIDIMAHPFEKVNNFFYYGKESSIINWYYEIKYYLTNKDK